MAMRRFMLFTLIAAAASPALAQAQSARGSQRAPDIVVTGQRLQDYRDRLAACLARNCPVNEDADASLALAEVEFEAGGYAQARRTIADSLDRNRRHAAAFPEPVADLFRARARVARHLGRDDEALRSTQDILRTLNRGLPVEDHRHFTARLEVAQIMIRSHRLEAARDELRTLAARARAAGRQDVVAIAELRGVWISYLMAPYGGGLSRLLEMSRDTRPEHRTIATGAKILLARAYRDRGERARSDAMIAEVARNHSPRRNLIFSPSYELLAQASDQVLVPDNYDGQWIDVGFWVEAEGRVDGLEIVRYDGTPDWSEPLLRSIRGRIYSPSADGTPTYRLERYTYTAGLGQRTGSRLMVHSGAARVEFYDLSIGEPPPELPIPERPPARPAPANGG